MNETRMVVVGAGGHAKVVVEAVRAMGQFTLIGATDPDAATQTLLGVPVLGTDDLLPELWEQGVRTAVVALGDNDLRQSVGERLRKIGFRLPPVIHPEAFLSPTAHIHDGAVIMARAVVGTQSVVRDLAIVNTGAILDHDTVIGEAAHVAPGSSLAGWVRVGARTLIGVGSVVRPKIDIGADVIIGAGSAVIADVADGARVAGVPARPIRQTPRTAR